MALSPRLTRLIAESGFTHLTATTPQELKKQHDEYMAGNDFADQWDLRISEAIDQSIAFQAQMSDPAFKSLVEAAAHRMASEVIKKTRK